MCDGIDTLGPGAPRGYTAREGRHDIIVTLICEVARFQGPSSALGAVFLVSFAFKEEVIDEQAEKSGAGEASPSLFNMHPPTPHDLC